MSPSTRWLAALALTFLVAPTPPATACFGPHGGGQHNRRWCFANQKTLAGALEMYQLDRLDVVTELTPELRATLLSEGYLQTFPEDPGFGPGSSDHYVWFRGASGGGVTCTHHGMIPSSHRATQDGFRVGPREQLRVLGVTDASLLARCREDFMDEPPRTLLGLELPPVSGRAVILTGLVAAPFAQQLWLLFGAMFGM